MSEFKVKSADELKNMTSEELHAYYVAKMNHEKEELNARIEKLEAEKDSPKFAELEAEVKKLKEQNVETLKNALKEQGVLLESLRKKQYDASIVMNADQMVEKALSDYAEDFKKSKEGRHDFKFNLDIKVAGNMTLAGNVTGVMPQATRLDGVNDIVERAVVTYPLVPKLDVATNTVEWVYETAQDGTIDGTAEGTAKDQIDNDFVVTSVSLLKRAAYFKVSTEMLTDVSFMSGWLRNKLIVRLFLDVDNQVLNGDGAGNNLNGIVTQATAFAAGSFALTVDNANEVDVLTVAANQIKIANQGSNLAIMMHPTDVTKLKLIKMSATDKRYIDRLITVAGQLSLDGIPIIENNNVTVGDYLIGDFSKALIVQKGGIMVEVGLDGSDFTNNLRTILAEWRGEVIIENNYTTAFVTGDFATDKTALETT